MLSVHMYLEDLIALMHIPRTTLLAILFAYTMYRLLFVFA